MSRMKAPLPSLRYHISGQSVVTIDGKNFYLGPHNQAFTLARYAVLIQAYQDNGNRLPDGITTQEVQAIADGKFGLLVTQNQVDVQTTVKHVTACFRLHIAERYANNPKETHRLGMVCDALELNDGDLNADQYGPLALQRQRQRFVDTGKTSRPYVNRLTNAIVRIFKHAVSQELVAPEVWQRLNSVEPLRAGQTKAKERPPVRPVDIEVVRSGR